MIVNELKEYHGENLESKGSQTKIHGNKNNMFLPFFSKSNNNFSIIMCHLDVIIFIHLIYITCNGILTLKISHFKSQK